MRKSKSLARFVAACIAFVFTFVSTGMLGVILMPDAANAAPLGEHGQTSIFGSSPQVSGSDAIAIGDHQASASGNYSIALGVLAQTSGEKSTALGYNAQASSKDSVALGNTAIASGKNSIALGVSTTASGLSSIALGESAQATGDDSTALGAGAKTFGNRSAALGWLATASADEAVAIGFGSYTDEQDTVSVGSGNDPLYTGAAKYRRIINVAAASNDNDAVTLGQLKDGTNLSQLKVGGITISSADNSISGVTTLSATTVSADNITGKYLNVNSDANAATASGNHSTALGPVATASGGASTALGFNAKASGSSSTALGRSANASGDFSIALGRSANASGDFSIALGPVANASGGNSTALGRSANASGDNSTALGRSANASADKAVAIGYGSYTDEQDTVSVGSGTNPSAPTDAAQYRRIINVAAASNDNDAVTLGQLKDGTNISQLKVGGITISSADNSISGVTTLTATGTISTSGDITATGNITGKYLKVNSAANAATATGDGAVALGGSATATGSYSTALGAGAKATGDSSVALGDGAKAISFFSAALGDGATASGLFSTALGAASTASADNAVAIGYGSYTDEQDTVSVGSGGDTGIGQPEYRRIINVKAASNDHDAVNYSQLKALSGDLSTSIGTVTTNLDTVSNDVATVSSDFYGTGVRYTNSNMTSVVFGTGANAVNMNIESGVLNFSQGGSNVKLSGIADGTTDYDAVNYKQLSALQTQVNTLSDNLTSEITARTNADTALEGQISTVDTKIDTTKTTLEAADATLQNNITAGDQNLQNQTDAITAKTDNITVENDGKIKISNLAEGTADNDAVNKKQLVQDGGMYIEPTQTISAASKTATAAVVVNDANANSVRITTLTAGENLTLTNDSGKGVYALSKNLTNLESVAVGGVKIDGTTNKITGIADGGIYSGSTEAVNGGQLYNAYSVMGSMQENITRLDQNIGYVGAHAAAMSALHAVPYNGSSRTTFTAGFGNYRGEQGYALGVFHYLNENVLANAAMSYNTGGDVMSRAGISFALGNGGHKKVSKAVCTEMEKKLAEQEQVIIELQNDKAEQSKQLAAQDEKLSELMKTVELLNKRLSEVEKKKK